LHCGLVDILAEPAAFFIYPEDVMNTWSHTIGQHSHKSENYRIHLHCCENLKSLSNIFLATFYVHAECEILL